MKLATLKRDRDGELVVVSDDLRRFVRVPDIADTLQQALDRWAYCEAALREMAQALNGDHDMGEAFVPSQCASPLPRAFHWADGSAYVNHVELVRKARNAPMPESFWHDPLMYQGGSDSFLGPCDPIPLENQDWGLDFEAEVAIIVDDTPMGVSAADAAEYIRLVMLVNDVSLRNLIPWELAKGFGFYQSKPSSAFSPVAVTPDSLGDVWREGKLHLPLRATLNDRLIGAPEAGVDMTFGFAELIAHAARTRALCAGTIIGSGTVSNKDRSRGSCCLAEVRMLETLANGAPVTPFMRYGDRVVIEMVDASGVSIFGAIRQTVQPYSHPPEPEKTHKELPDG